METNKNEHYYVSVEDTIKYGIIKAAIIGRVKWWCQHNKDNNIKDRYRNDEWWSGFMTPKVFAEQLGIPVSTIKNNLVALINDKILIKDKFNKKGFDKTNWYRVNPNPPQIQSSYRKDTTIVSERYNDSTGAIQSIVSERYNDSTAEIQPIPDNLSVNQNVKHTINPTINPTVNREEDPNDVLYNKKFSRQVGIFISGLKIDVTKKDRIMSVIKNGSNASELDKQTYLEYYTQLEPFVNN